MYVTKDNVIEQLEIGELIVQSYIYSSKNGKYWKIQQPITVQLSSGRIINIPKGFVYDMSTVPKWLWSFVRPFNDGLFGYLIHDALYINKVKGISRREADKEMLFWTNIINENKFDNYLRYYIVRLLGWLWWYEIV